MREKYIKSADADYQKFEVLRSNRTKRYHYGEFLVEGVRSLKEAKTCGWEIKSLIYPDAPLSASTTVTRFLPGQAIEPISFAFFGVAPLTQFAVSPDLPAGLRLSQQNVIEGTPTGTFDETTFTVTARSATA